MGLFKRFLTWMQLDESKHPVAPLLMAATIPVLLFAGWMAYSMADAQRAAALAAASVTVDRVAERIAAEINAQVQVAQILALSSELDEPDLAAFRRKAERVKAVRSLWRTVELDDLNGWQIMNLLRPAGEPLGQTAEKESLDDVVRDHRPVVGGVGPIGPVSGQRLVPLRVPVMRDGTLRYVLTIAFDSDAIDLIMERAGIPPGWVGVTVDRAGNVIALSPDLTFSGSKVAGSGLPTGIEPANEGLSAGRTHEGVDVEQIVRVLPEVGHWSVRLGIPLAELETPVHRALLAVASGVGASLVLAGMLAIVIGDRFHRRRTEEASRAATVLQLSEARGQLATEAAGLGTWRWDVERDRLSGSERFRTLIPFQECAAGEWPSAELLKLIHQEDRAGVVEAAQASVDTDDVFEVEFRVAVDEGRIRWLRARGRVAAAGTDDAIVGVIADISDHKRAEYERIQLLRRLANAQEEVQARIARELHDQIGQTVTGLSLGLKGLERTLSAGRISVEERERMGWLQKLTGDISRDIHRVAADLRPTALDDLGLQRALAAYTSDWGERYGMAVDLELSRDSGSRLSAEIETAVYRVVQEGLTNILKHAQARRVSLIIERNPEELRVLLEDDGAGFDTVELEHIQAATAPSRRRLGLSGMRERLAAVRGSLEIESGLERGTTLFVRVPTDRMVD